MGEGGFEPPKALPADLQSVPFGHSGIPPYLTLILSCHSNQSPAKRVWFEKEEERKGCAVFRTSGKRSEVSFFWPWSWWTDSNPRPADYKSAALPTELHQRSDCCIIISRRIWFVNSFFEKNCILLKSGCWAEEMGLRLTIILKFLCWCGIMSLINRNSGG